MSTYYLDNQIGLQPNAEPIDIICRYERIPTTIKKTAEQGSINVAHKIAELIRQTNDENRPCVLGLTSGKSPVGVYRELVKLHSKQGLNFENVIVFTMFEYYPIISTEHQSYNLHLQKELLGKVNIKKENIHLLDGSIKQEELSEYCRNYEQKIKDCGGIDLLLLGIGDKGQIALNESGTYVTTKTRVVALSNASRKIATTMFYDIKNVPTHALTIGIETIIASKNIQLVGWSEEKASVFYNIIEGQEDANIPATILQQHPSIEATLDEGASSELTRIKTPWLVGTCIWTPRFIRKAVLWLCHKVDKPILKLTYQDYMNNQLGQLIDATRTSYDNINIQVFNDLQHTISGWPGGKPNSNDTTRPVKSTPYPKKVLIFSPHPDDDVISMGGTFLRLVDQGHDVHVAYQTSGNIAVHDDVVVQIIDTARECGLGDKYNEIQKIISNKIVGAPEPQRLREFKGSIRRAEAKAACRHFGVNDQTNAHFLNLPFYETGSVQKGAVKQADIDIVKSLLRKLQPNQIYAAGDLSDPHGTHRICIEAVLSAIDQIFADGDKWIDNATMWLYRGAWQEWDLDMVDMAVPLSPDEVIKKRHAIYRHLSQKDIVPFPGEDKREFWQRAEDRTQNTANMYDKLGMAEYQAIEVFVKYEMKKN